jgi:hypothetical protein
MDINQSRAGSRIPVELPAEVRWKSRSGNLRHAEGKTENISGSGLFLAVPVRPHLQTPITIRVPLPAEVTGVPVELVCHARVVRWSQPDELQGVAAIIDDYELRPASTRPEARSATPHGRAQ